VAGSGAHGRQLVRLATVGDEQYFKAGVAEADLIACLDAWGCDEVVVVGPGMGGPWAIALAAALPERVKALVLVCDLAGVGEVLVSEAVRGLLLDSDVVLTERGRHVLKGVPNERLLFAVER
jgi:pimeloyl-ACP methyl ester carboxylesterase